MNTRTPIVIDTREQRPYAFDSSHVEVIRAALPAGDYSICGHEESIAVERKSLGDFVGTVINARGRFTRELEKLATYQAAVIVVEANLQDVIDHKYRSRAHPNAVLGSMIALQVEYGVPIQFCPTRELAGRFTAGLLRRNHKRIDGM